MKSVAIVAAIVIVAAGIASLRLRSDVTRRSAGEIVPAVNREPTPVIEERLRSKQAIVDSTSKADGVARPAEEQSSHTQSDTDDVDTTPDYGSFDAITLSEVMSNAVDNSVIGRQPIISPATTPSCIEGEEESACQHERRLEQFTGEPRDPAWASGAEMLLRSMAKERNQGFSIRSLECRLTTCIIEVESIQGILGPQLALKPNDWRKAKVKPFGVRTGHESNLLGEDVTLTLWIYERIR